MLSRDACLARGDPLGEADLRRAITPTGSDSRVETRVRCYVNGGGAYHSGRLHESRAVRRCWSACRGRAHRRTRGTLRLSAARRSRGRATH